MASGLYVGGKEQPEDIASAVGVADPDREGDDELVVVGARLGRVWARVLVGEEYAEVRAEEVYLSVAEDEQLLSLSEVGEGAQAELHELMHVEHSADSAVGRGSLVEQKLRAAQLEVHHEIALDPAPVADVSDPESHRSRFGPEPAAADLARLGIGSRWIDWDSLQVG